MANAIITVGNHAPVTVFVSTAIAQSAPSMLEAVGYTRWTFMIDGSFAGASVTILGTIDRLTAGYLGQKTAPTGTNWFVLSPVSGGGQNPLTATNQQLQYNNPLLAVSANITALTSGSVTVLGFAVP